MQQPDLEKLLIDLRAAKAFLDRVECQIRALAGCEVSKTAPNAPETAAGVSEAVQPTNEHFPPEMRPMHSDEPSAATSVSQELFDIFGDQPSDKSQKSAKVASSSAPKGANTLTRRKVLANFREIAGDRKILDLSDVNRIFGYNRSTSGTFVKHAVKRGELGTIPYGKSVKFLTIDVRAFIKSHFDRLENSVQLSSPTPSNS